MSENQTQVPDAAELLLNEFELRDMFEELTKIEEHIASTMGVVVGLGGAKSIRDKLSILTSVALDVVQKYRESFQFPDDWRAVVIDMLMTGKNEEALQVLHEHMRGLLDVNVELFGTDKQVRGAAVSCKQWRAEIGMLATTRPAIDMRFNFSVLMGNDVNYSTIKNFDFKTEMVRAVRMCLDEMAKANSSPRRVP